MCRKLGSLVGDNVNRNSMEPKNVENEQFSSLLSQGEFSQGDRMGRSEETDDDSHDAGVPLRSWESCSNLRPRTVRDGEWFKEFCRRLVGRLVS